MEVICDLPKEDLPFMLFGLCLQEPMSLITNLLVSVTALIVYYRFDKTVNDFQKHWRNFYLLFGISTFFGGFGHLFYQYTGVYGKFPSWIFALLSAFQAGKAMLKFGLISHVISDFLNKLLYLKLFIFTGLALYLKSFIWVVADAGFTYLIYCMSLSIYYRKKGFKPFIYIILGVILSIPTVLIFIFEINLSIWFNKDDLSHVIIAITIILFYFGIESFKNIDGVKVIPEEIGSKRKIIWHKIR